MTEDLSFGFFLRLTSLIMLACNESSSQSARSSKALILLKALTLLDHHPSSELIRDSDSDNLQLLPDLG